MNNKKTAGSKPAKGDVIVAKDGNRRHVLVPRSKNRQTENSKGKSEKSDDINKSSFVVSRSNVCQKQKQAFVPSSQLIQPNIFQEKPVDNFDVYQDVSKTISSGESSQSTGMEVTGRSNDENKDQLWAAEVGLDEQSSVLGVNDLPEKKQKLVCRERINYGSVQEEDISDSGYLTAKAFSRDGLGRLQKEKNFLYTTSGFGADILRYQIRREAEQVGRPRLNYMKKQKELNVGMRAVLVDWLIDVCQEYELCPDTFFLAVSLVDRTLSIVDCPRAKLQLMGASAIFIASKIEEVSPPPMSDIVFVTDNAFTAIQVRQMERVILRVVDFELSVPLVNTFADYYTFLEPISARVDCLMRYLIELSALHYESLRHKASILSASAYVLAIVSCGEREHQICPEISPARVERLSALNLNSPIDAGQKRSRAVKSVSSSRLNYWSDEFANKTGIERGQLLEAMEELAEMHRTAEKSNNKAAFLKYSTTSNFQVSCDVQMPGNISSFLV